MLPPLGEDSPWWTPKPLLPEAMRLLLLAALAASMLAPCGEIAAQWRPINFVDEFGDSAGRGASSAPVRSIQPMRSPYEGTTARIVVNCTSV